MSLMLCAPLCAVEPDVPGPTTLHAVTQEGLTKGWPDGPLSSACGVVVKLLPHPEEAEQPIPWPPRLKGMSAGFIRCGFCFVATGRGRPRSELVPKDMMGGDRPQTKARVDARIDERKP